MPFGSRNTKKKNRVRFSGGGTATRKAIDLKSKSAGVIEPGNSRKRRTNSSGKGMTIPELKHSFDTLENEVRSILKMPAQKQVSQFQGVWRKIFGRPVDTAAASAYLQVKSKESGASLKTRKSKGGGGSPLSGAPIDFQTRPGVDGVHGSFPAYISNGFSFYNTINQSAISKDCGVQDITPRIGVDMGSNKVGGGGLADALTTVISRPFTSDSPVPSVGKDLQDMWMGRPVGPSPAPEVNPFL